MLGSAIELTAQSKFWMAAMTGAILLSPNSGLASEQWSTHLPPGVPLLEEGEPRAKPVLPLEARPFPQQVLENPAQVIEAVNQLDTAFVEQPREQPREQPENWLQVTGAETVTNALGLLDQSSSVASIVTADVDPATAVPMTKWPIAQAPTPNPSPNPSTGSDGDEAVPVDDLATAAQNPIANLISVPFQNNTNFGLGPNNDQTQNVLNIQPVVPIPLTEDLLLVTRTILPIVAQPDASGSGTVWGLGDLNPTFFFVPATRGNLTWGIGPTMVLPTATDRQTGTGQWSAGPAGVVVVNSGPWVYGGLVSQVWSFAGDSSRSDVSLFLMQPFATLNLSDGWYVTSSPVITANWNASSGNQWTVPIGGGVGRVFQVGNQPLNASLQLYWNAARPSNGADVSLRAQVQMLFPR